MVMVDDEPIRADRSVSFSITALMLSTHPSKF